jgi:hypothetical protein
MNSEQNCETDDDIDDINLRLDGLELADENDINHISPQINLRDLPADQLQSLLLTYHSAYILESMLSKRSYLPLQTRKYLQLFTSTLLPDNLQDKMVLCTVFNKRPKEVNYIPVFYRNRMLFYFNLWKNPLLEISYHQINDYLYKNGELTPKFYEVMAKIPYINEKSKSSDPNYIANVGGTEAKETFYEDVRKICPGLESKISYLRQIRSDDCDSRSGDVVSEHSIDVPMLPLAESALEGIGRGTVGAHLLLNKKYSLMLTNAHVIFGGLTAAAENADMIHIEFV